MNIIPLVVLILCGLASLFCIIMLVKNRVTYRHYEIIGNAIFAYHMDAITRAQENGTILDGVKYEVEYDDMRSYDDTILRIHDWGYKNILPADKFEIIKPYIHK